jgi:hypothetical protein
MSDIVDVASGLILLMYDIAGVVGLLIFVTLVVAVFFLPTIVVRMRGSVSFVGIFLVNLLAGATGIFWLVALIWACVGTTRPPSPPSLPHFAGSVSKELVTKGRR